MHRNDTTVENWDEIRTAYQVARLGTVSAAAEVMGVHHATVIRHVDALEKQLGARLFQRHARGYTPTEAGRDLMSVAEAVDAEFSKMVSRIRGQGDAVTGELVVTSIRGLEQLITPVLQAFQAEHPGVRIRFLTDMRLFRLDHGEAHVAIRAGAAPKEPDYVVQPLMKMKMGLYASEDYIARHGLPETDEDLAKHRFISVDTPEQRAPYFQWLAAHVPEEAMVYRTTDPSATDMALRAGIGLAFSPAFRAALSPGLVEVFAPRPEWSSPFWLVTHVDLHRTTKVQAILSSLKAAAQGWEQA